VTLVRPLDAPPLAPDVVGVLGARLSELLALELPVAPGFVVGTAAWHLAHLIADDGWGLPETIAGPVRAARARLEGSPPLVLRPAPAAPGGEAAPAREVASSEPIEPALQALLSSAPRPIAIVVQACDGSEGRGSAYTRDPLGGGVWPVGEYRGRSATVNLDCLSRRLPAVGLELRRALARVEAAQRCVCQVDFTLARGRLWIDDARPVRRAIRLSAAVPGS
jgi:hypothetical protein